MPIICDTHVLLYWADQPKRLSAKARRAVEQGVAAGDLACADISLWEIAMLFAKGRLNPGAGFTCRDYTTDILAAMRMRVLPITPEIAELSQSQRFEHGDPGDRLIAATAMHHRSPLITADEKLRALPGIRTIW